MIRCRTSPGPTFRLLTYRLYACQPCDLIYESTEIIMRESAYSTSKHYLPKVEAIRRRRRAKTDPDEENGANSVRDGTGPDD